MNVDDPIPSSCYETHSVKDSEQAFECLDAQPNWKINWRIGSELVSAPTARLPLGQSSIDSHPSMSPNDRAPARFNSGLET